MGEAVARRLHAEGYTLALMSPSGSARRLAEELGGIGVDGSVANADDLKVLVDATLDRFGRVDAVVNHTGFPPKGPVLDIADDQWHLGMDLLLLNVVRMCRLVTPMLEAKGGSIVNISSYAAFEPDAAYPVSAALRAALASFTKLYADTYAARNIRMNTVLPGFVDTHGVHDPNLERIPMRRYAESTEVADVVAFLLSDGASYVTGQNIRIDGGLSRHI
jgi:NAD(P)-dependent dehydrogenase (short-subunit alcohol dehydrogenase family)